MSTFRIHPAIGIARVGNSDEFYLAPETIAGMPQEGTTTTGGLPIRAGTENETITSSDLRDAQGAFKRQAARFRIYAYTAQECETYPNSAGEEVQLNSTVNGKTVVDIIWTVHVANKKANTYVLENPNLQPQESIIDGYADGKLPPVRNPDFGDNLDNGVRLRKLTIDPGPRTIRAVDCDSVQFNKTMMATYCDGNAICALPNYPKSYPDDHFNHLFTPTGNIDTLGELQTDQVGRLLFIGAYGRACSWTQASGTPYPLEQDVDNDGWFDDTADGPVSAVLVFDDGSTETVHGAWVVSTDPGYAPQTLNAVSLWDDIYDSWVRKLHLQPELFDNRFQADFVPKFDDQIYPFFLSAALQQWNTNLPARAIEAHQAVGAISATDNPADTIMGGLAFVRNPNNRAENSLGVPMMPLALGDSGKPFLSATQTQYFLLQQWNEGKFTSGATALGAGEALDRTVLMNCLGGRFSPGIDMTFIVRQPDLYQMDWQTSQAGPFRIKAKPLNYNNAQASVPFLTAGYVPLHSGNVGLEPGDTSKFMAIPWHTDYNSCAVHETDPNPLDSNTLYWSWPAQRPVAVYAAKDVVNGQLGEQRFSVRGEGTETNNWGESGRYQNRLNMVKKWHEIGVVIQGSAIDEGNYSADFYLEVESQLDKVAVPPWPLNATPSESDD